MAEHDPGHIKVRNWEKFQHYKQRNPPWIRVYNELLDDYAFNRLQDASKWHAVGLWLLASRFDNRIPADPIWIQQRIGARSPVDLDALVSAGFIESYGDASAVLAPCKQSAKPETETEGEGETETERDANASIENAPVSEMHAIFVEVLGGTKPHPKLTPDRREKYRLLWDEQLSDLGDWPLLWRSLLLAITESDFHMNERRYQMPESFLRSAGKRDTWMQEAAARLNGNPRLTEADRRLMRRRRDLEEIDFAGEAV